jgi:Tetracyclin repressor-like, C-terminal domain
VDRTTAARPGFKPGASFDRQCGDRTPGRAIPTVNQAIDRGELAADTDADALLTTFRAPLFYRLVTTGDPIDEELITRAARVALTAARAGPLSG